METGIQAIIADWHHRQRSRNGGQNFQEMKMDLWEILSFSNSKGGIEDIKFNGEVPSERENS